MSEKIPQLRLAASRLWGFCPNSKTLEFFWKTKNSFSTRKVVVGVGFEPTNARSGRIYSPHPLATWIPYQDRNLEIYRNTNLRQADYLGKI